MPKGRASPGYAFGSGRKSTSPSCPFREAGFPLEPNEIYTPPGGPPPSHPQVKLLYQKWGETKIRKLVSDFYDRIQNSEIQWMFQGDWELAKEKQADFMIQVLGGPSYYIEKWGPARMRMRHFAFPISEKERLIWFQCYDDALQGFDFDHEDKIDFLYFLDGFSAWMVNRKEPPWEKYSQDLPYPQRSKDE